MRSRLSQALWNYINILQKYTRTVQAWYFSATGLTGNATSTNFLLNFQHSANSPQHMFQTHFNPAASGMLEKNVLGLQVAVNDVQPTQCIKTLQNGVGHLADKR